jgi:hypothetical protein
LELYLIIVRVAMGCRSSTPIVEHEYGGGTGDGSRSFPAGDPAATSIDVLTLADLARFDNRRRFTRRGGSHEDRMADIAALQQSLSLMETFFESLLGQASTGFFMEAMDPNNNAQGPPPASDAAIASLIQSPLTAKELILFQNKMCSVCCEVFKVDQVVSRLPCGHVYHPNCVEPWLARHCTCPSCRYELPTDDDDFEEGRMERMNLRKLPEICSDCDASSHSSEDHPDVTWDETSTASGDEEGVHLMDGYQQWYGFDEDFQAQEDEETRSWFRDHGLGSYRSREEQSWMMRLIDEDVMDRPTSTLPAAMRRSRSQDVRGEDVAGEEQRTGIVEEPTPRTSNSTSRRKTQFDDHSETRHPVAAIKEEEFINKSIPCGDDEIISVG